MNPLRYGSGGGLSQRYKHLFYGRYKCYRGLIGLLKFIISDTPSRIFSIEHMQAIRIEKYRLNGTDNKKSLYWTILVINTPFCFDCFMD